MRKSTGTIRTRVIPHRYRGKDGFQVSNSHKQYDGTWRQHDSMFTETLSSAEHIRQKMLNSEEITVSDFEGKDG